MKLYSKVILGLPAIALCLSACTATKDGELLVSDSIPEKDIVSVHARFAPEREDDFLWENDRVGFRVFGPASSNKGSISGVDPWFKSVDYLVLDKWYKQDAAGMSYHIDHGEGADLYPAGTSRAVGGTAIWLKGKPYPAGHFDTWEILENDGQTVSFEIRWEWPTPIGLVAEHRVTSLSMGDQLYRATSQFFLNGKPAELPVAIGLTTHEGKAITDSNRAMGLITAWETIDDKPFGTAVLVDPERVTQIELVDTEVKDEGHIWIIVNSDNQGYLEYAAGFGWSGAGIINTPEDWEAYLVAFSKR